MNEVIECLSLVLKPHVKSQLFVSNNMSFYNLFYMIQKISFDR